jgi:hypothetical protein
MIETKWSFFNVNLPVGVYMCEAAAIKGWQTCPRTGSVPPHGTHHKEKAQINVRFD